MASHHRLFVEQPLAADSIVTLDKDASHYLARVLRLRAGAAIELFNGDGYNYTASLTDANKTSATLAISTKTHRPAASPKLHLAIAVLKGDKLDYALQKATELDVASVWLMTTERSELRLSEKRLANRLAHWQRIMRSACEQSGRTEVPELHAPQSLQAVLDAMAKLPDGVECYCLEPSATPGEFSVANTDLCLFTGPEGGFSEQELHELSDQCTSVQLGELVLRAETAPLVGLALAGAARRRN